MIEIRVREGWKRQPTARIDFLSPAFRGEDFSGQPDSDAAPAEAVTRPNCPQTKMDFIIERAAL